MFIATGLITGSEWGGGGVRKQKLSNQSKTNYLRNSFLYIKHFIVGYGLKCYECTGTDETCSKDKLEGDKDTYLKTCADSMDKCMRVWSEKDDKTGVWNSCANEDMCDTNEKSCDESDEGKCAVGCCDSDECNASSRLSFSVILMAACSVFGLALLK